MGDTTMERGLLMLSLRLLLLLMLPLRLRLTPGMDTTDTPTGLMAMDTMDTDLMAMDTTMERGLLMLSLRLLLLLMPLLPLRLTPGTDIMAMASTDLMAMDTMESGLMAMVDTTMERGPLMLRLLLLLMLLLPLRLMLMPGMDTTDMPTGLMAIMAMAGERSKKHTFYQTAAN